MLSDPHASADEILSMVQKFGWATWLGAIVGQHRAVGQMSLQRIKNHTVGQYG